MHEVLDSIPNTGKKKKKREGRGKRRNQTFTLGCSSLQKTV
jgi:hypothetical protein